MSCQPPLLGPQNNVDVYELIPAQCPDTGPVPLGWYVSWPIDHVILQVSFSHRLTILWSISCPSFPGLKSSFYAGFMAWKFRKSVRERARDSSSGTRSAAAVPRDYMSVQQLGSLESSLPRVESGVARR